ncbi:MAG: maleylpyruvate isomerase family mycothiol-dependent enzyme [Acidimicrobiales bacterium]
MKLSPQYDTPGFFRFEGLRDDTSLPLLRQRRRLASILSDLDDAQWAAPSRCDEWSVQDVIAHLVGVNQFWAVSIASGRHGEPTRFLSTFDPVASPAEMVDSVRSLPWATVLERFVDSIDAVAESVAGLDEDGWSMPAEAPPGHVPLRAVALHALWDAWIHERDITLPLGLVPVEEADEIAGCLRYAAALSPAFAVASGSTRRGSILIETTDPEVRVVIDVGEGVVVHDGDAPADALHLTGSAVELVEALSYRVPLPEPVADEHQWMLDGLAQIFDRTS